MVLFLFRELLTTVSITQILVIHSVNFKIFFSSGCMISIIFMLILCSSSLPLSFYSDHLIELVVYAPSECLYINFDHF
jgi:hypothetical protein